MLIRIFLVLSLILASSIAMAGSITVVGDINAQSNNQFYLNVLGTAQNVLFGRSSSGAGVGSIYTLYNGQPGVSVTNSNTTITSTILSNYGLLVFNHASSWDTPLVYTSDELSAIGTFLQNGGNVLLVAETSDDYANFNAFLSGVGSSIRYTGERIGAGLNYVILAHPLTTGVTSFSESAYNTFTGGTTLVKDTSNRNAIVTELIGTAVPEPNMIALLGLGCLAFLVSRRK